MKNLSKYITDKNTPTGFCQICERHGKLKKDHVPPKAWRNPSHIEYVTSLEGITSTDIIRQRAHGGVYFRTLCESCNSVLLGSMDRVFKEVVEQVRPALAFSRNGGVLESPYTVYCNTSDLIKASAGHILAAVRQSECSTPPEIPNHLSEMRDFLTGNRDNLDNVEARIWPYLNKKEVYVTRFQASSYIRQRQLEPEVYSTIACYPFGITFRLKSEKSQTLMTRGKVLPLDKDHFHIDLHEKIPKNYGIGIFDENKMLFGFGENGYHGSKNIEY